MNELIQLTNEINVNNSAHILYIFENPTSYLDNLIAFVKAGVNRHHHLLIIEDDTIYAEFEKRSNKLFSEIERELIHYIDNNSFYRCHGDFHIHSIVEHFGELLQPFLNNQIKIRTWAHVEWNDQHDISKRIEEFETIADNSVNQMELVSVCAYNSSKVTALLQMGLMKSHEYLMTDREFVKSSFYRKR